MAGVGLLLWLGSTGVLNAAEQATTGNAGGSGRKATQENLQNAYNGEANAKARYEAFAVRADEEGYKAVAALFRATAKSEGIHADKHAAALTKIGGEPKLTRLTPEVKSTKENLEAALKGETEEKDTMYPAFIGQAQATDLPGVVRSFKGAMASEESHAKLYKQALDNLESWKAGKEFVVCTVCGYTAAQDPALRKCPVCDAPRGKFETVK